MRGTDRMTAQDKILGKFRKAINQSGSMSDNTPLSLKEQLEEEAKRKKKEKENKSNKDDEMFSKLNSNINRVFRL